MAQPTVSRRNVLGASAAFAASGVLEPARSRDRSAIVIGAGIAGSIAAYRLGRAGIRTTVLERGGEARETVIHRGDGITVLSGSGLRGEVVATAQPRRSEWEQAYPGIPYAEMDQVYWPRARAGLDYLGLAQATGNVTVLPHHEVTEIREGFEVRCGSRVFHAHYLFMAAGSIGTSALLVTARQHGWLPRLRASAGEGIGTNGDFLVLRLNARSVAPAALSYDNDNPFAVAAMTTRPAPGWAGRATAHLVTSMAPERGAVRFDEKAGLAKLHWPYGVMETKAEKAGRDLVTRLWWQSGGRQGRLLRDVPTFDRDLSDDFGGGLGAASTWHPLGGMAMGQNTDLGGRSLDYENLYCVDSSALPGTACLADPSLTIAANAERCLDRFITSSLSSASH
jgi:choline dehydrogenase-like flavoprotein